MSGDGDHDEGDEERDVADRAAPVPDRRIPWGTPPAVPTLSDDAAAWAPDLQRPDAASPPESRTWPMPTIAATPAGAVTAPVSSGRPAPPEPPAPPAPPPAPRPPAKPLAKPLARPPAGPATAAEPTAVQSQPTRPATEPTPAATTPTAPAPDLAAPVRRPASPAPRPEPAKPASITDLAQQLTAIQAQLSSLGDASATPGSSRSAEIEHRAAQRADATVSHLSRQFASLEAQLGAVGDRLEGVAAPAGSGDTRALERTAGAITELSQQLAATQAQVASLAAQLTTLAHRVTYDLERAGQTTVERVLRDLPAGVGAVLGPAIDDLTDQVEADAARVTEAIEGTISARLASVGEIVDELPLTNTELLNAVRSLDADLEDRFSRLANRLGDQVTAFEEANAAELARLRDHVFDLADAHAGAAPDREVTDRMAAQVDRLVQSTVASDTAEAVEVLIAEHLEVLRDELEARLAALEATLTSHLDAALAEQLDGLDALVAERVTHAVAEAAASAGGDTAGVALAAITEELKALRRRITLRLEGDAPTGMSPEQVDDLATQVARRLRTDRPARGSGPRLSTDSIDPTGTTDPAHLADARRPGVPVVRSPRSAKPA